MNFTKRSEGEEKAIKLYQFIYVQTLFFFPQRKCFGFKCFDSYFQSISTPQFFPDIQCEIQLTHFLSGKPFYNKSTISKAKYDQSEHQSYLKTIYMYFLESIFILLG